MGLQKIIEGSSRGWGVAYCEKDILASSCFGNLNVHINVHILSCKPRITPENLMKNGFQGENMAERQGFEPWVPFGTSVFKTGAFDHSATSPVNSILRL